MHETPEWKALEEEKRELLAQATNETGTNVSLTNMWAIEDAVRIEVGDSYFVSAAC